MSDSSGSLKDLVAAIIENIVINSTSSYTISYTGPSELNSVTIQAIAEAVWAYTQRALTEAVSLTPEQAQMLLELHKLEGLQQASPLVVTPTQRSAGDIVQQIGEAGTTITITRQ